MNKFFIVLFGISLFLFSCRSTKTRIVQRELKEMETGSLLDSIVYQYGDYSTFSARFNATISNPKSFESKGSIRIQKDSVIWISLSPLLIEAFRCMLTRDSVFIVNRLERTYYAGNYDILQNLTGFTVGFQTLQAVFLNELWVYPTHNDSLLKSNIEKYEPNYKKHEILFKKQARINQTEKKTYSQEYTISTTLLRLVQTKIEDYSKQTDIFIDYSDFRCSDSLTFPNNTSFKVKRKDAKLDISLEYSRIEFNQVLTFPFSINSNFTPWQ